MCWRGWKAALPATRRDAMGGQMEAPRGWQADAGPGNRYATAAGTERVARAKAARHKGDTANRVTPPGGGAFTIYVKGRTRWALERLIAAGPRGCTLIEQPAPRWSAYIHKLRELGVAIETLHETHAGAFPGHHGRYVLRCDVRRAGA